MQAGKLDRRIIVETRTDTKNSIGEWIPTWSELTKMWAGIEFTDSKENFEAQQLTAPNEVTFHMRYNSSITAKMRIVYDGIAYDIKHIAEVGRRKGLKVIGLKKDNTNQVSGSITITEIVTNHPTDQTLFTVILTGQGVDPEIASGTVKQGQSLTIGNLPFDTYVISVVANAYYTVNSIVPASITLSVSVLTGTCTITHYLNS